MTDRMMDAPLLLTDRLLVTVPGSEAAPRYAQFCRENAAFLEPWQGPFFKREFAVDFWQGSLDRRRQAFAADRAYSFGIFWRDAGLQGPLLGYCNFSEVVRGLFQACYLGYALAESSQGKGIMTEALEGAIQYMFATVKVHRIMANYMPHNNRSAAVLARLGFVIDGSAQSYLYINGAWRDHVLTSLINPEPVTPPQAV
ncbi:MAG: GNAT family N-acetyltransferase [Candidatus Eremiobacteraeota bacterium]|nr:GNAT family N-acetyltransferase [Candidatus Eremiobacteraeota bacterium]